MTQNSPTQERDLQSCEVRRRATPEPDCRHVQRQGQKLLKHTQQLGETMQGVPNTNTGTGVLLQAEIRSAESDSNSTTHVL